jgi:hypothetical protein
MWACRCGNETGVAACIRDLETRLRHCGGALWFRMEFVNRLVLTMKDVILERAREAKRDWRANISQFILVHSTDPRDCISKRSMSLYATRYWRSSAIFLVYT